MTNEKLIFQQLDRLFWLLLQAPGVARYKSDIVLFTKGLYVSGAIERTTVYTDLEEHMKYTAIEKMLAEWDKERNL